MMTCRIRLQVAMLRRLHGTGSRPHFTDRSRRQAAWVAHARSHCTPGARAIRTSSTNSVTPRRSARYVVPWSLTAGRRPPLHGLLWDEGATWDPWAWPHDLSGALSAEKPRVRPARLVQAIGDFPREPGGFGPACRNPESKPRHGPVHGAAVSVQAIGNFPVQPGLFRTCVRNPEIDSAPGAPSPFLQLYYTCAACRASSEMMPPARDVKRALARRKAYSWPGPGRNRPAIAIRGSRLCRKGRTRLGGPASSCVNRGGWLCGLSRSGYSLRVDDHPGWRRPTRVASLRQSASCPGPMGLRSCRGIAFFTQGPDPMAKARCRRVTGPTCDISNTPALRTPGRPSRGLRPGPRHVASQPYCMPSSRLPSLAPLPSSPLPLAPLRAYYSTRRRLGQA